jgi:molybdenum cofactor cytidylyltransferase
MGNLVIIILAAGSASRMGAPKQLLPWKGKTVIENMVELTTALPNTKTLVVTGAYNEEVEEKLVHYPINCIYNSNWKEGMGSSISVGVQQAEMEKPEGIMVILADQLAIQQSHLMDLIQTFYQKKCQYCVSSFYSSINGVPAIFPKKWYGNLKNLKGDRGARKLFQEKAEQVYSLPLNEAATDIDTPKDWEDFIG